MEEKEARILTRDEILGISDSIIELVEIPAWEKVVGHKVAVHMKSWTASERDSWEAEIFIARKKNELESMQDFRARMVAKTVCDPSGKLLFTARDIKLLGSKSAKAIDFLFDKAQELNGMRKEDLERMIENLPEGQTAD
jgi:hypothetical protein